MAKIRNFLQISVVSNLEIVYFNYNKCFVFTFLISLQSYRNYSANSHAIAIHA